MDKTISQMATELSISRQAVHQALDKVLDKKKLNKRGNAFVLNTQQQEVLIKYFNKEPEDDLSSESSTSSSESTSNLTITLQRQNEFLMRELEVKNQQINELHILLLKEKEKHNLIENEEEGKSFTPKEKKQSLWEKIFGGRK